MKHSEIRGLILIIAVILIFLSSFYFDSYKIGGPMILLPIGSIAQGSIFLLSGLIVFFDSFFSYRKTFRKRKNKLIDGPFTLSWIFIFFGVLSINSGIQRFLSMDYFK